MDQPKFQDAQAAYDAGDYRAAAKGFLAAAGKGPAGSGAAYHMAGNALMRLRRHQDAVTVYGHSLRDDMYDRRGAVQANLGQAFSALGDYASAEKAFEAALAEPDYRTPWKAWQGTAAALLERGKVDEAAVAYRKAAIDPGNPEPGKALVNLGLCFMALARPADAAEAYKAALGVESYPGRGKALANLGIAYTQIGEYEEAVRAFEKATQLHGHRLSATAQQAYDSALTMVRPVREVVDGWETGDLAVVGAVQPVSSGWATGDLAALGTTSGTTTFAESTDEADSAASELGFGDENAVTDFFARTEEEMKVRDREARRVRRSEGRADGGWVKRLLLWAGVVVVIAAAAGAAYWFGFGWPTQETAVLGMLEAYKSGGDVTEYWVAVTDKDVETEMAKVPPGVEGFSVDSVVRGPGASEVDVTVTPEKGAPLHYKVTLRREGVGWKVDGIDNDWRSTGDS